MMPEWMKRAMPRGYRAERVTSGESGARVWRLTREGRRGMYWKSGPADEIVGEVARLRWLHERLPAARVLGFGGDGRRAWMMTEELAGRPASEWLAAGDSVETVGALAEYLRRLHGLPVETCPFVADHGVRLEQARRNVEAGVVDETDFDEARRGWSAERVWRELQALRKGRFARVVTHGDFSLDNVHVDWRGRVTGVIDAGRLGVADPYQDLAVLWNNLGEFGADVQRAFLRAYGVRRPDQRRLAFHLCLDELF